MTAIQSGSHPIEIDGIQIPSNDPIFLTIIAIHVAAALICVVSGVMAMFANKKPGLHPKSGSVYFWGLVVVYVTVAIIAFLRWQEDYYLFLLGSVSFALAIVGRQARRKLWTKWSIVHISCMGGSYIILITAFYVDNGKFLPVWKDLPSLVYWILPSIVGIPVIIRTLLRHPLSKMYFRKA